ncbi:MAG: NERD domain-containing protein [Oscillospiraceae bacterium]|nr:NERD domain-containing protein [Oscillospiraceae bacterium]
MELSNIFKPIKATVKGFLGEVYVANMLSDLPKEEYVLLNDVMLPTPYGTTQIDHIIVSVYGIFIIETKTYGGTITGGEYSEKWSEHRGGKKFTFLNPLRQNYGHVKTLEQLLNYPNDVFFPIVAFSGECKLKVQSAQPVIYMKQLKETILSHKENKFPPEELLPISNKIRSANQNGLISKISHNQQVKEKIKTENDNIANMICPKCGGNLVQRKGKYGEFLGCSNFPKCRFTLNQK